MPRRLSAALGPAVLVGLLTSGLPGLPAAPALAGAPTPCRPVPAVLTGGTSVARALAPGVTLTTWSLPRPGGRRPLVVRVVRADLAAPHVSADLLAAGVTSRTPLHGLARSGAALAGVNGDFFSLGGRGAVLGPEVQSGVLRKATTLPQPVLGVGVDRTARLSTVALSGRVQVGRGSTLRRYLVLSSLNAEQQNPDGFAAYTSVWGPDRVPAPGSAVTVVTRSDRVVSVGRGTRAVPAGSVVVVARGAAARALAGTRVGTVLAVRAQQRTPAAAPYRAAIGGSFVLVRGGAVQPLGCSLANETPRPRTAIGLAGGGRHLLLVVVEGAAPGSREAAGPSAWASGRPRRCSQRWGPRTP